MIGRTVRWKVVSYWKGRATTSKRTTKITHKFCLSVLMVLRVVMCRNYLVEVDRASLKSTTNRPHRTSLSFPNPRKSLKACSCFSKISRFCFRARLFHALLDGFRLSIGVGSVPSTK